MRPLLIVTGGLAAVLIVAAVVVAVLLIGGQPVSAPSDALFLTPSPSSAPTVISTPTPMPALPSTSALGPAATAVQSVAIPTPTATTAAATTSQGEAVPEEDIGPLLPPDGVALFGRISGGATSDTLRTTDRSSGQIRDIRIESSSYAIVMVPVLPDRGEPIVIETYTSPS